MDIRYKFTKLGCYFMNINMAIIVTLSPLLFVVFREIYDISYTLLGLLIFINFSTQLLMDLLFTFFSKKFNIKLLSKSIPFIIILGMLVYALTPYFSVNLTYVGLLVGTFIFSVAGGLLEVLINPLFVNVPNNNDERALSKLHSMFAWGVIGVVVITTLFLNWFSKNNWQILVLIFTIIPLICGIFLILAKIPEIEEGESQSGGKNLLKNASVWVVVLAMFFGSAMEGTISQWSSSFLEKAVQIPKVLGDIFGVAFFSLMLGIGRTLYSKFGKNIINILLVSSSLSIVFYLLLALVDVPVISIISVAMLGLLASMVWPGSLMISNSKFGGGVAIYALMAAGGDFGAAVGSQYLGYAIDLSINSNFLVGLANKLSVEIESLAMRFSLLTAVIFPIITTILFLIIKKMKKD